MCVWAEAVLVGDCVVGSSNMFPPPQKPHSASGERYEPRGGVGGRNSFRQTPRQDVDVGPNRWTVVDRGSMNSGWDPWNHVRPCILFRNKGIPVEFQTRTLPSQAAKQAANEGTGHRRGVPSPQHPSLGRVAPWRPKVTPVAWNLLPQDHGSLQRPFFG